MLSILLIQKVVKIDKRNHRFFIASHKLEVNDIALNIEKLRACFSASSWKNPWSLSVFSEEKYAGYKDEGHIVQYHEDNSWAKAYVAEYSEESGELMSYPFVDPQKINLDK